MTSLATLRVGPTSGPNYTLSGDPNYTTRYKGRHVKLLSKNFKVHTQSSHATYSKVM
jgi:hypothetical protein